MFIHTFSLHLVTEPECVLAGGKVVFKTSNFATQHSTDILGTILCNKSIHLSSDLLSRICMLFLEGLFKDFALSMELSQLMIKLKWDRFNFNWRERNNRISWTIFSGLQYTLVPRSSTSNEVHWTELIINKRISGGLTKCF